MDAGGPTEVELMGRYCDGDAAAFAELYNRVAPRLLGYIRSIVRDQASAEDILQQSFLKIHQARPVYVRGADPLPWFYTIAHRTTLDELRRRKGRVQLGGEHMPEARAEIDGAAEGTGASQADPGLAREAMAALAELPELQREAVLLIKVHGRSVSEAAAITGSTPSAIKLRAHRGYVALRKRLGKEAPEQ